MATDIEEMEDLAIHPEPDSSSPFASSEDEQESAKEAPKKRQVGTIRRRRRRQVKVAQEPVSEEAPVKRTVHRQRKPDLLPSLLAMGWGTVGMGAATFGHLMPDPLGKALPAAGRMMQLQSKAGAGQTLDKALRKTPIYRSIKPLINALNPYAEIAGLLTGPLIVGAIALRPELLALGPIQGAAMMVLLPAVRQASAQAETELTAGIGEYSKEEVLKAQALLDYLVSGKLEGEEEPVPVKPEPQEATVE